MRILVFFDLPTDTKEDKRAYTRFRKFLLNDGYDMLQFSVYSLIVKGEDNVDRCLQRIKTKLPSKGSIRFLQVTEKQYANMQILLGQQTTTEIRVGNRQTLLF